MQRTYSRKGTRRVARPTTESPEQSPERAQLRKKRKIQVEVVTELASSSTAQRLEESVSGLGSSGRRAARQHLATSASSVRHADSSASSDTKTTIRAQNDQSPTYSIPGQIKNELLPTAVDSAGVLKWSSSTGGIAKRMLRRTRTESSLGEEGSLSRADADAPASGPSPRKLAFARTESIIDLTADTPPGSAQSLSPQKTDSQHLSSSPSKPVRPPLPSSTVRTYAGKSRSFLVALPPSATGDAGLPGPSISDEAAFDASQEDDIDTVRESYTDLRMRWGVDNSEDDPYPVTGNAGESTVLPPNMMNDLKSISELRSKGETRRFLDEMGYLFEGLNPSGGLGVRRGSAMEIVTKLCDEGFARRAKVGDFFSRAWDVMRAAGAGNGDKVLDTVLVVFAALVARDAVDLQELTAKPDFVSKLFGLLGALEHGNDPLWLVSVGISDIELKRVGIARSEKPLLTSLHRMIRKRSGVLQDFETISNRLLISRTLSRVPPALCNVSCLSALLSSIDIELRSIPGRISSYSSGLPLFPPLEPSTHSEAPSLSHVDNILHLLDSYILGQWDLDDEETQSDLLESARGERIQQALVALCVAADALSREEASSVLARRCLESVLRVLISLTHDDHQRCEQFSNNSLLLPVIVRVIALSHGKRAALLETSGEDVSNDGVDEQAASLLDRLCLALGLFTNLVQSVNEVRDTISWMEISPECPGTRSCTATCRCPTRQDAVTLLTGIYAQHCQSTHDLDTVVRGHMAILLGLIIRDNPVNQRLMLNALPGPSNKHKLHSLIDNAKDFTTFYADFARRVAESQIQSQDQDDAEVDGDCVQDDSALGRVQRDTKGEVVANDVIGFLEDLHWRTHD